MHLLNCALIYLLLSLSLLFSACNNQDGPLNTSFSPSVGGTEPEVTTGDPAESTSNDHPTLAEDSTTGNQVCTEDDERCEPDGHQVCVDDAWLSEPCASPEECNPATGRCDVCTCDASDVCLSPNTIETCGCFEREVKNCDIGEACDSEQDTCMPVVCIANNAECDGNGAVVSCNETGTGFLPVVQCGDKEVCSFGECQDACKVSEVNDSSIGCDFWAVDMANVPPRDAYVFAVSIANPSQTTSAHVVIYDRNNNGEEQKIAEGDVAPRETQLFPLSGTSNGQSGFYKGDSGFLGTGIGKGRAFRITSDMPIVATQFNPLGGAKAFTTDASLLLPTHTLGQSYYHLAWKEGLGAGSALVVIATQDNTVITLKSTVDLPAENGLPALIAGQDVVLPPLKRYDYLQISSGLADLTSSKITATAPVAVFGGHSCGQVPNKNTDFCDHLEEQIFPLSTWGQHYVAARAEPRKAEPMMWRIIAAKDDTLVKFNPPVSIGSEYLLKAGGMIQFPEKKDFEIVASDPVMVSGYLYGCKATGLADCPGDPSMVLMVPVEQWLNDYVFLVDSSYTNDHVKLVREKGETVSLGCFDVVDGWMPINEWYESTSVNLNPGVGDCHPGTNTAQGSKPFSIMVVGEAASTSYAYPGGLALKPITPG